MADPPEGGRPGIAVARYPTMPRPPSTAHPSAMLAVLARCLTDIRQHPLLARDQEQAVAWGARGGDEEAVRVLVSSNLRFVVKIVCGYPRSGLPIEDLVQEGNIGL